MSSLYDCSCEACKDEKINLAAKSDGPVFKAVLKAAEKAFKYLHEKGSYKPEDITDKPYQKLIEETYKVFNSAVTDNDIPDEMLAKLQNDTFIFSGLRTHAQLLEASTMLMEDGKIRGFDAFAKDFNQVNTKYNQNYLEAEWQFAVSSSQSAANWAAVDEDGRYNLQYRTANDDRVRADHAALQNITLPKEDPFWMSYYPPNGWRCRCTAVEVLKTKYELSDSVKANEAGDRATTKIGADGKNKSAIFRFNPGMENKVFPPKHPYNKVKGAEEVKNILLDDKVMLDLKDRGFTYRQYDEFAKNEWNKNFKKFNILELDDDMTSLAKKYNLSFDQKKITSDDSKFNIEFIDSKNRVTIERSFYVKDGKKVVDHSYFEIPEKMQGKGFSKEVFQLWHKQYINSGLDKINLHANLNVGGYTWAKYGFIPKNSGSFSDKLESKMNKLMQDKEVSKDEYDHYMNIHNDYNSQKSDHLDLHKISNTSYGKKLLLGSDWRGEMNLKDEVQRGVYEDYLFGR